MLESEGAAFLHRRNQDFHNSASVVQVVAYLNQGRKSIPNEPAPKIAAYLGFLADKNYVNDGLLNGEELSMDHQLEALLVKPENVQNQTEEVIRNSRYDQKDSLQVWVDYLIDSDYPDWFKKYAFDGMTTLGPYDKNKKQYAKRSKSYLSPFAELNQVALQNVYASVTASDEASFRNLYAAAIDAETARQKNSGDPDDGQWTIHAQQNSLVDAADELATSLLGHNTGWCINACLNARDHLKDGSMHVYRTKDAAGEYTVPRIAIHASNDEGVYEVRGVDSAQEIEAGYIESTVKKLKTLPKSEFIINRAANARRVLELRQQVAEGHSLSLRDRIWLRHDESATFAIQNETIDALLSDTNSKDELIEAFQSGDPELVNYARSMCAGQDIGSLLRTNPARKCIIDALIASSPESAVAVVQSNVLMQGSDVDMVALSQALMGSKQGQCALVSYSQLFESVDVDQSVLAKELMHQDPVFLASNIQEFVPGSIDQTALAEILLKGDWLDIRTLAEHFEDFNEGILDPTILYQCMLDRNDYMTIFYNRDIFPKGLVRVGELMAGIEAYKPQAFEESQLSQPQLNHLRATQDFSDLSPKQLEYFERLIGYAPPF